MIRPILAAAVAGLLIAAAPIFARTGFAQTGTPSGPTTTPSMTQLQGAPRPGTAPSANPSTAQTGCRNEMSRANSQLSQVKDPTKRQQAMSEMNMARDAMSKNDETGCMSHVQNAMRMAQ